MLSSKKAIVAIFAVALMLFSAGIVVFTNDSMSVTGTSINGEKIVIGYSDGKTTITPKVAGFDVDTDNKTVIISADYTTDANTVVEIDYSDEIPLTIIVDGKRTLTSTSTDAIGKGICIDQGNVTIKGKSNDKSIDSLTVKSGGKNTSGAISVTDGRSLTFEKITVIANARDLSGGATFLGSYGIEMYGKSKLLSNDAIIIANGGSVDGGKTAGLYLDRNDQQLSTLKNSQVYLNGGNLVDGGSSYGIYVYMYECTGVLFDASKVIAKGLTSAVYCNDGDHKMPMSCLTNIPNVYGSTDAVVYVDISDQSKIDIAYKIVNMRLNPQYTVTYDIGEGATGDIPAEEPHEKGETFTVKGNTATKEGYAFIGWLGSDGKTYQDGDEFTMGDASVTFTAQWKGDASKVTITVKASPSQGGTVTGGGTFEKDSNVTIKATANTGYHFVKWDDGNTNASRTVKATENKTYTAVFEADGAPEKSFWDTPGNIAGVAILTIVSLLLVALLVYFQVKK